MTPRRVVLTNVPPHEARPVWNDKPFWSVNGVAVEAAWSSARGAIELPGLRPRRAALLDAFPNNS